MNLFRVFGIAILVVGAILIVFGIRSTDKVSEKVVEGVTGHYTDTTMWYIIGGIALVIVGGGLIVRKRP